jgi:cytoplasmic iron level regulating protein YaaA (DUF328/UPF0246 family)
LKILFSPSETKNIGGDEKYLDKNSLIFNHLYEKRVEILNKYLTYIATSNDELLAKLFGTKKQQVIDEYKKDIFKKPTTKALLRYSGVAYEYLDYSSLSKDEQGYCDANTIIFSNLFGPIGGGDLLPDYKLQQGQKLGDFTIEEFYQKEFQASLDELLEDEEVLDLRAGFYERFYKIQKPYTTMKFLKDGKVVSHWAKAYRGIVLKEMAKHNIKTIKELLALQIESLKLEDIKVIKNKTQITYSM